jgi:hypothetical protein
MIDLYWSRCASKGAPVAWIDRAANLSAAALTNAAVVKLTTSCPEHWSESQASAVLPAAAVAESA